MTKEVFAPVGALLVAWRSW